MSLAFRAAGFAALVAVSAGVFAAPARAENGRNGALLGGVAAGLVGGVLLDRALQGGRPQPTYDPQPTYSVPRPVRVVEDPYIPRMSNDCELFPGMDKKWGLSFLINTQDVPGARSANSLAWAGINNTYYWLDPSKKIAGVLMTQILPFADPTVLGLLDRFERAVYAA